jgi:mono/diheme cytochrome c family protein
MILIIFRGSHCLYYPEMKTMPLLLMLLFSSCSRVNVAAQDHYREQHIRHGVYPLGEGLTKKFDEASVARGKALYTSHCLSCHGDKGKGDGQAALNQKIKPADLQKLAREVSDFKFFMSVSQWQGDMPGWKDPFTESDREDLVAYIKTFK